MTDEDKKIYEFCGFKFKVVERFSTERHWEYPDGTEGKWEYPDGTFRSDLPPIDANFIFEYAVPKLDYLDIHIDNTSENPTGRNRIVEIWKDFKGYNSYLEDPVESFKQALLKLIEEKG